MFKDREIRVKMVKKPESEKNNTGGIADILSPEAQKLANEQLKVWGKKILYGIAIVVITVKVLDTIDHISVAKIQNHK